MSPDEIRRCSPTRAHEFVGAENRPPLARLGRDLLKGNFPSPILLVAPFGYAKTSLARWCLRALDCEAPDPETGEFAAPVGNANDETTPDPPTQLPGDMGVRP